MDIYSYLKKDHRTVSMLFQDVIEARTQQERENIFLKIQLELELHAGPEQATFYKALASKKKGKEDVEHGIEEHKAMKAAIKKLLATSSSDEVKWLVLFGELKRIVEHHVLEEESKMFKDAKKIIGAKKSKTLVEQMEELKNKMYNQVKFIDKYREITGELNDELKEDSSNN